MVFLHIDPYEDLPMQEKKNMYTNHFDLEISLTMNSKIGPALKKDAHTYYPAVFF